MKHNPETLRTYAAIFEKPRRGDDKILGPPTEIEQAAATALRFMADHGEAALFEAGM
jgi:hypothetical protein